MFCYIQLDSKLSLVLGARRKIAVRIGYEKPGWTGSQGRCQGSDRLLSAGRRRKNWRGDGGLVDSLQRTRRTEAPLKIANDSYSGVPCVFVATG